MASVESPTKCLSRGCTWDFRPVDGHLHHRNAQLLGQEDELHVEAPPLQPRVAEQLARSAARHQLQHEHQDRNKSDQLRTATTTCEVFC